MAWVLATSLAALRRDLDAVFPNRDRSSDGTIGDTAHQGRSSGHNPDDTPGSRPESTDADNKPEVRAYDADNDLRDPRGIDFQQVIDAILATSADRDRLAYIIHRRRIWRKRAGWRREVYTGASPHDEHAHFSGDPASDEDARPWTSILSFQQKEMRVDTTPNEVNDWTGLRRIESLHKNLSHTVLDSAGGNEPNGLHEKLQEILTAVQAAGWTQEQREALAEDIAARVLSVLAPPISEAEVDQIEQQLRVPLPRVGDTPTQPAERE